jgi:hypothetical protein
MKTTMYYFSSTGNSLSVARGIAEKLQECTLISMAGKPTVSSEAKPAERVGFVFPVYFFGLPRLVKRFIENLELAPQTSCFGIVTYGGRTIGTLSMLEDVLRRKNCFLHYAEKIRMPGNYIALYPARMDSKIKGLLNESTQCINRIADELSAGRKKARSPWPDMAFTDHQYNHIS